MKRILLTGATGYIGKRLLPVLLEKGYEVIYCVRDRQRFDVSAYNSENLRIIEVDFLNKETLTEIPDDMDAAYFLIHSMSASTGDFEKLKATAISGNASNHLISLNFKWPHLANVIKVLDNTSKTMV